MPPQTATSKNEIRTMRKDIDLLEGKVGSVVDKNPNKKEDLAVKVEQEARIKEEFK